MLYVNFISIKLEKSCDNSVYFKRSEVIEDILWEMSNSITSWSFTQMWLTVFIY